MLSCGVAAEQKSAPRADLRLIDFMLSCGLTDSSDNLDVQPSFWLWTGRSCP